MRRYCSQPPLLSDTDGAGFRAPCRLQPPRADGKPGPSPPGTILPAPVRGLGPAQGLLGVGLHLTETSTERKTPRDDHKR